MNYVTFSEWNNWNFQSRTTIGLHFSSPCTRLTWVTQSKCALYFICKLFPFLFLYLYKDDTLYLQSLPQDKLSRKTCCDWLVLRYYTQLPHPNRFSYFQTELIHTQQWNGSRLWHSQTQPRLCFSKNAEQGNFSEKIEIHLVYWKHMKCTAIQRTCQQWH